MDREREFMIDWARKLSEGSEAKLLDWSPGEPRRMVIEGDLVHIKPEAKRDVRQAAGVPAEIVDSHELFLRVRNSTLWVTPGAPVAPMRVQVTVEELPDVG